MQLKLNLEKHCIETALKRLHNRLMSDYFKAKGENREMEARIDVIGRLLEGLNFSFLRSHFPDLAGHTQKDVTLSIDDDGRPHIFIAGDEIDF